MAKIILFIRDPGRPDFTDVHDSHMQAKAALLDHVKSRWSFSDLAIPTDSERAIKDFFARSGGSYVIAEVEGGALGALSFPGEA